MPACGYLSLAVLISRGQRRAYLPSDQPLYQKSQAFFQSSCLWHRFVQAATKNGYGRYLLGLLK